VDAGSLVVLTQAGWGDRSFGFLPAVRGRPPGGPWSPDAAPSQPRRRRAPPTFACTRLHPRPRSRRPAPTRAPQSLDFTALDFYDASATEDMAQISPATTNDNLDHQFWHGYWTGPLGWNGLRVLAYQARFCPVPYGCGQNCRATVSEDAPSSAGDASS
jgi:hypothetical protein